MVICGQFEAESHLGFVLGHLMDVWLCGPFLYVCTYVYVYVFLFMYIKKTCLVSSCLVLSRPVSSRPVSSCLVSEGLEESGSVFFWTYSQT